MFLSGGNAKICIHIWGNGTSSLQLSRMVDVLCDNIRGAKGAKMSERPFSTRHSRPPPKMITCGQHRKWNLSAFVPIRP